MAKNYWVRFGSGKPSDSAGLAPTFIQFWQASGATLAPPSIAQIGSSSGLYTFSYTPTVSIGFVLDGATTGLADAVRYVVGSLDPADRIDEIGTTLIGFGVSTIAFGSTLFGYGVSTYALGLTLTATGGSIFAGIAGIGSVGSTFGGASTDPIDLFGYLKRTQEFLEGNQNFLKSTGVWDIYSRGYSSLLTSKTLSNDTTGVTKI